MLNIVGSYKTDTQPIYRDIYVCHGARMIRALTSLSRYFKGVLYKYLITLQRNRSTDTKNISKTTGQPIYST